MKKLLLFLLLISLMAVQACQKKERDIAFDTTSSSSVTPNSSTPATGADYNPNYTTPPSNRVADAVAWTATTLNNRDSAGFWNSLTWEDRDSIGYPELFRETRTLWDSTKGSRIEVAILTTNVFSHTVHDSTHVALFAHATINMRISGAKAVRIDSLTAILRVENGKWMVGSYSFDDPNKPFLVNAN